MKVLLDTVAFLKWTRGESLPRRATALLQKSDRYVSVVTPWEIAIKSSRYPAAKLPVGNRIVDAIEALGATVLPITLAHIALVYRLPPHHGDPFDRMLISQAIAEEMTILSSDERFPAYKNAGLRTLWD